MQNPLDDQNAARGRKAVRNDSAGVPAVVRNRTIWVTPTEQDALTAGILPPSLQARLDRQDADDAVILDLEEAEEADRSRTAG